LYGVLIFGGATFFSSLDLPLYLFTRNGNNPFMNVKKANITFLKISKK
jgi:hypothetical protein